jgi:DNA-binding CsgD family transcriptional regulator
MLSLIILILCFAYTVFFYQRKISGYRLEISKLQQKGEPESEHQHLNMETIKLILLEGTRIRREKMKKNGTAIVQNDEFFNRMKALFFKDAKSPFNWEVFYRMIDERCYNAITQIRRDCPNFPAGQLQYYSLLLAKFSTRDIAFILFICLSSVRMKKMNLRRYLNVPKKEDLVDFIIKTAKEESGFDTHRPLQKSRGKNT